MRIFIAVLVLIFNLQSWTKADDIRDFEIEGMSIGDSLLDFMSKSYIDGDKEAMFPNDKYLTIFYEDKSGIDTFANFHVKGQKNYSIFILLVCQWRLPPF